MLIVSIPLISRHIYKAGLFTSMLLHDINAQVDRVEKIGQYQNPKYRKLHAWQISPQISNKEFITQMSLHALPPSLISPYTYLISTPGKNVRSHLIDSFNKFYLVPPKTLASIKEIVSMLHNASLLIDDIEDNSSIRRGRKSAHLVYGVPATINCGNYLYFACVQLVQQLPELDTHPNPNELRTEAMNIFINECLNLHRGQGYDILWRDTGACPTMEQYNDMINDKTGGLFRIAVGLMRV